MSPSIGILGTTGGVAKCRFFRRLLIERFRFKDEDHYEYQYLLSTKSCKLVSQLHFAGKCDSRRHSTTSFTSNVTVAGTSYQMLEVVSFCYREIA